MKVLIEPVFDHGEDRQHTGKRGDGEKRGDIDPGSEGGGLSLCTVSNFLILNIFVLIHVDHLRLIFFAKE